MSEAASAEKPAKNQGNEGSSHCSNGEERRQDSRKDRHRIPWKEQGFALFRRDDWKFVLDEHNAPAAAPRLLADAGQRVMPGVFNVPDNRRPFAKACAPRDESWRGAATNPHSAGHGDTLRFLRGESPSTARVHRQQSDQSQPQNSV